MSKLEEDYHQARKSLNWINKNEKKVHRFKGEGQMYWCDFCGHRHVTGSIIGREHWNKR